LLGLLTLFSLSLFLIPGFIIRPFTHQSEIGLRLAIAVKRIAPALTIAALVLVVALGWRLWRTRSALSLSSSMLPRPTFLRSPLLRTILSRTAIVIALLLSTVSAVMVRQNYFEWMFNPIKAAGFVPPADAKLSDKEMVMAVRIGQEARAYPILQMSYHHILNDTVAGVPIVVTY
jgi:hypothetical protein